MAAPKPGILHGLYTEQDIKIKFRCNHALQILNAAAAHPAHEHLAFIMIFKHQKREDLHCSENIHLLPLIASAADYQNRQFPLPIPPEWPGPPPLLKGYLVPVFVEKTECTSASASSDRMFQYLGYHRIMSIEYYLSFHARPLGAHEIAERLIKWLGERFRGYSTSYLPRLSKAYLSRLGIKDAMLKLESVEESKAEENTIPEQERRSGGNGSVEAVIREEGDDEWVMVPEMRLMDLLDKD